MNPPASTSELGVCVHSDPVGAQFRESCHSKPDPAPIPRARVRTCCPMISCALEQTSSASVIEYAREYAAPAYAYEKAASASIMREYIAVSLARALNTSGPDTLPKRYRSVSSASRCVSAQR